MEKKHQVFVSSTYTDLIQERQQVIHALLELDCIPAGMELFPAVDEDSWSLIKEVIDESDYYVLVVGGKYGSIGPEGQSYTEMEYDYAYSLHKPIIAFIHSDPENLPAKNTEKSQKARNLLEKFTQKIKRKHYKRWSSPEDLGGKVSRSLVQLRKKHPSDGWIPGKYAADESTFRELETLRARVAELERDALASSANPPEDIEDFVQGGDVFRIQQQLATVEKGELEVVDVITTWDNLFSYAGSSLMGECDEQELNQKIRLHVWHSVPRDIEKLNRLKNIVIQYVAFDRILIQFQALGLISRGIKKRAVANTNRYWKLTAYGEKYFIKISAIRRNEKAEADSA